MVSNASTSSVDQDELDVSADTSAAAGENAGDVTTIVSTVHGADLQALNLACASLIECRDTSLAKTYVDGLCLLFQLCPHLSQR